MADTEFRRKLLSLNFGTVHHAGEVREIKPSQVRPVADPSWEKGLVGEKRADGSFMPVLSPTTGQPMKVHEAQSHRHAIEENRRHRASGYPLDPSV